MGWSVVYLRPKDINGLTNHYLLYGQTSQRLYCGVICMWSKSFKPKEQNCIADCRSSMQQQQYTVVLIYLSSQRWMFCWLLMICNTRNLTSQFILKVLNLIEDRGESNVPPLPFSNLYPIYCPRKCNQPASTDISQVHNFSTNLIFQFSLIFFFLANRKFY